MKELILSSGETSFVDDDVFKMISKHSWICRTRVGDQKKYASRTIHLGKSGGKRKTTVLYLHRFILGLTDASKTVDHIDGNGLNNCRSNLRICSQKDNAKNVHIRAVSQSGYKGVRRSASGKWYAMISSDHVTRYLGSFLSKTSAAIAYNNAAIKFHGEFAQLNHIP